jgi:hypothetical protein
LRCAYHPQQQQAKEHRQPKEDVPGNRSAGQKKKDQPGQQQRYHKQKHQQRISRPLHFILSSTRYLLKPASSVSPPSPFTPSFNGNGSIQWHEYLYLVRS